MPRIVVVGPDPEQAGRWETALDQPVAYAGSLETAQLELMDVVLLDLLLFRVGSSEASLDEELAVASVKSGIQRNPDAFWLVITPPVSQMTAIKLSRILAKSLSGGIEATGVALEPHDVEGELGDLSAWAGELARITDLQIDFQGMEMSRDEERCVRRLLRDVDSAQLAALSDGQGQARTLRVACRVGGGPAPLRVIKLGPVRTVETEYRNYMRFVRGRLGENRHPTLDTSDFWRAGQTGALSYTFVAGQPRTLAEVMAEADGSAPVAEMYSLVLRNWHATTTDRQQQLSAFVDEFLQDVTLNQVDDFWTRSAAETDPPSPIPWLRDISGRDIVVDLPTVVAHGDLHGYNILVDDAARPWLIDFYHTDVRSGLFDFSYAESALLLHRPAGRGVHAAECSLDELKAAEERGDPTRAELGAIRDASRARWGAARDGLYQLARCCAALRRLRFPTTDISRAKWVAHFAALLAQAAHPDWQEAPARPPIAF